jgi:nicotinate-nucleotide pyrophosphorylase
MKNSTRRHISAACVGLGNEINNSPCTVQLAAERTSVNLLRHTAALRLQTRESLKNCKKRVAQSLLCDRKR